MSPLDLDQFRARFDGKMSLAQRSVKRQRPPRHNPGEWFLKGPIPGSWLVRVFRLPARKLGRALRVGIALWYLAGVKKNRVVKPTWDTWERFCLSRYASYRGLLDLERAKLVKVKRRPGCCPVVTILDATPKQR